MLLKQILEGLETLSDEQRTAILAAAGGEGADVSTAEEQAAAENLQAQLDAANGTIKTLQKGAKGNETLEAELTKYKDQVAQMETDHKAAIKNMAIDSAIEGYLRDNGAKHPDLLATKFDRDALVLDASNKVTNVADIGGKVKEAYKDLFAATLSGTTPANPDTGAKGGTYDSLVENADNMSVEELTAQLSGMEF